MKKIFPLVLVCLSSFYCKAQLQAGVKAGVNISDPVGRDAIGSIHGKGGFYAGGLLNLTVAKDFQLQPELTWSSYGYKYNELGGEFNTTFSYVQLAALAQYGSKSFFVETGPQLGFLILAKSKGGILGTQDIKDSFKSTAFSWVAGAGYRMQSGFGINARYVLGIGSISNNPNIDIKFDMISFGLSKTFELTARKK